MPHPSAPGHWLDSLENQTPALVRLGHHGRTGVEWQDAQVLPLYLQRTAQGQTCALTVDAPDCAEYDPRHAEEEPGWFQSEDYVLLVLEAPLGVSRYAGPVVA